MESNDSPEIPDRGETSDIPGFPSGVIFTAVTFQIPVTCKAYMVIFTVVTFQLSSTTGSATQHIMPVTCKAYVIIFTAVTFQLFPTTGNAALNASYM